jgi:hypothetical protein
MPKALRAYFPKYPVKALMLFRRIKTFPVSMKNCISRILYRDVERFFVRNIPYA